VLWWKKPDRDELFPLRAQPEAESPPPLVASGSGRTAAR
jgi:hypothetical protein